MQKLTTFEHRQIFMRDKYRCVYCGREMLSDLNNWLSLEVDHLIPSSQGGTDDLENLVTSCNVCNKKKAAYSPENHKSLTKIQKIKDIQIWVEKKRANEQNRWAKALLQYNYYLMENYMVDDRMLEVSHIGE